MLKPHRLLSTLALALAWASPFAPTARGHFLWITAEGPKEPGRPSTVRAFLNETPEPGGPEFLKYVEGIELVSAGSKLATAAGDESVEAPWVGAWPTAIEAERDLGVKAKDGKSYRLYYLARVQARPVAFETPEAGDKLRVRLVRRLDGKVAAQAVFAGKPAPGARFKAYKGMESGDEVTAGADGTIDLEGLAEGRASTWAQWVDPTPGEVGGKPFAETRYYASLTVPKAPEGGSPSASAAAPATTTKLAPMPDPAVNSLGAAVLGDWLYVYSGHTGKTHQYSVDTTSKHFRRLSLADRTTWEELPMAQDVQGVALVSDGRALYRVGGMRALNPVGQPQDLRSVADFARFDPETKTWTDLDPLPKPRSTHDAVAVGRKIYAVGGWCMMGAGQANPYHEEMAVFDLDAPELGWKTVAQPFRRRAMSAAEAGGKIYVLGGLDDQFKISKQVDIYDPKSDTWSTGPDLPAPDDRDAFATSSIGLDGTVYFSGLAGTIDRLAPSGASWEAVGAWEQPRNTHRLVAGPGRSLIAVGGNYKGQQTAVVEVVTPPSVEPRRAASNP